MTPLLIQPHAEVPDNWQVVGRNNRFTAIIPIGVAPSVDIYTEEEPPVITTQSRGLAPQDKLAKLPTNLAGAKPRYGFKSRLFELEFERDMDKAFYILGSHKKSKHEKAYLEWLLDVVPDITERDIKETAQRLRDYLRLTASTTTGDVIRVPADWESETSGDAAIIKSYAADFAEDEDVCRYFVAVPISKVAEICESRQIVAKNVVIGSTPAAARKSSRQKPVKNVGIAKYAPDQPRDKDGKWTGGSSNRQIHTSEFKEWFGNWDAPNVWSSKRDPSLPFPSVVINKDGSPMVVYHATDQNFSQFETGRLSGNNMGFFGNFPTHRHGIFASPDLELAHTFIAPGTTRDEHSSIMPLYMNIRQPLDVRDRDVYYYQDQLKEAGASDTWLHWFHNLRDAWESLDDEQGAETVKLLKKAGFDGMIFKESDSMSEPRDTYVAFDPEQVKSAIGNRGAFDRREKDITKSRVTNDNETVVLELICHRSELGQPLVNLSVNGGRYFSVKKTADGDVVKVHEVGRDAQLRLSAITIRPWSGKLMKSVDISDRRLVEDLAKAADWDESEHPRDAHGEFAHKGTGTVKMTRQDAKDILADIETAHGRIAAVAAQNPAIRQASVEAVRQRHGDKVTVYRVVQVREGQELREDKVASTTEDFKQVVNIMQNQPGALITRDSMIFATPTLLMYHVPVERVVADVGLLAELAAGRVGSLKTVTGGRNRVSVADVLDTARSEKELVVDLNGVKPTAVLPVKYNSQRALLFDALRGSPARNIDEAIESFKGSSTFFSSKAEAEKELGDTVAFINSAHVSKAFSPSQPRDDKGRWTDQTDTPEFKGWFGGSKMVDDNGKPKVFYHGTKSDFASFSNDTKNRGAMGDSVGFYFSDDPAVASNWSDEDGGRVMPVYLSIKNPLVFDSKFINDNELGDKIGLDLSTVYGAPRRAEVYWYFKNGGAYDGRVDARVGDAVVAAAKAKGYDGVVFKESIDRKTVTVYCAFDAAQIKSKFNRGTWSKDDADITKRFDPSQPRDDSGKWTDGGGVVAYHGTSHDVPRFSTQHIGEGEGAQSYGYGLYFAENPSVAREYRDAGVKVSPRLRMVLDNYNNNDDAIEGLKQAIEQGTNGGAAVWQPVLEEAQKLPAGKIYQVKINVKTDELLDWDKKLVDQPTAVKRIIDDIPLLKKWRKNGDWSSADGRHLYEALARNLESNQNDTWNRGVYVDNGRPAVEKGTRAASAYLLKIGIPGIRYLDQGSRYGSSVYDAQQALDAAEKSGDKTSIESAKQKLEDAWKLPDKKTHNLVIFDDSRIHITHVNDKPLTEQESIAKTAEWREDLHPRDAHGRFDESDSGDSLDSYFETVKFKSKNEAPPQLHSMTPRDFEGGLSCKNREVTTVLNRMQGRIIRGQPHLIIEGEFRSALTNVKIGGFGQLYGLDSKGQLYVDFMELVLNPNYQKEGIGADFIQQAERFYKKVGAKYVTLVANLEVGGLAWSLHGYDFDSDRQREEVKEWFTHAAEYRDDITTAQAKQVARDVAGFKHSWEFTTYAPKFDTAFGRKVMLANSKPGWSGVKSLDEDSLGYKIGEAYQKARLKRVTVGKDAEFESEHPRGEAGKFEHKNGDANHVDKPDEVVHNGDMETKPADIAEPIKQAVARAEEFRRDGYEVPFASEKEIGDAIQSLHDKFIEKGVVTMNVDDSGLSHDQLKFLRSAGVVTAQLRTPPYQVSPNFPVTIKKDAEFEAAHPRQSDGEFAPKGQGEQATAPAKAPELKYPGAKTRRQDPDDYFFISTGAKNNFYTLRHFFTEPTYANTEHGAVCSGVKDREYHLQNLSTDKEQAIKQAEALTGLKLSAEFDVMPIGEKRPVDWSVFQGGKYAGSSIHEVREQDPGYLIWIAENQSVHSKTYGKTVELIQSLMEHELRTRSDEKKAAEEKVASERASRVGKYKPLALELVGASDWPDPSWQEDRHDPLPNRKDWIVSNGASRVRITCDLRNSKVGWWRVEGGGFVWSVASELMNGELPGGRGLSIMKEILAKQAGRRNSKPYQKRLDEVEAILETVQS